MVSSGVRRALRGEEGGVAESVRTMTAEPWGEGRHGLSQTGLAGMDIGKEEERVGIGMTGMIATSMRR